MAAGREQAGVEAAVGRKARTRAVPAERRADRIDEADLAAAVGEGMATRDLARVVRRQFDQRPTRVAT